MKIKLLHKNATFKKAYDGDVGYDLTACSYEYKQNGLWLIGLGVAVEPPPGYHIEIVPRSSFSKTPFIFPHNVGVIDGGYRGEVMFPVRSLWRPTLGGIDWGQREEVESIIENDVILYLLNKRIAQAIIRRTEEVVVEFVDELSESERGVNGLGSSGA